MKKRKQQKLEKKRRQERLRRLEKQDTLAYHGNKFKNEKLTPLVYHTEVGIYEAFVSSGRKITDHDIRRDLEWLIRGIRSGTVGVDQPGQSSQETSNSSGESIIIFSIRRHWEELFAKEPFPGRDNLIGVLRTILGSVETWGNISPTSRGYLRYLEGFMGQLGVHCREVSADFAEALINGTADMEDLPDEDEVEDESELLLAGRAWAQGDRNAGVVFRSLAIEMIAGGEAEEVAETCQQLMGETRNHQVVEELGSLSIRAQEHLRPVVSRPRSLFQRLVGR